MSEQSADVRQLHLAASLVHCSSCGSKNLSRFESEIALHFPGLENITKPDVWVFPVLVVCFDCGIVRFTIADPELRQLAEGSTLGAQ